MTESRHGRFPASSAIPLRPSASSAVKKRPLAPCPQRNWPTTGASRVLQGHGQSGRDARNPNGPSPQNRSRCVSRDGVPGLTALRVGPMFAVPRGRVARAAIHDTSRGQAVTPEW